MSLSVQIENTEHVSSFFHYIVNSVSMDIFINGWINNVLIFKTTSLLTNLRTDSKGNYKNQSFTIFIDESVNPIVSVTMGLMITLVTH